MIHFLLFACLAYAESTSVESVLKDQKSEIFAKGKGLYDKHCMACHAPSNIMVASPKLGDQKDWGARLETNKTLKGLAKSAFKGKDAMPPKGLCLECKEKDLEAAIVFMMKGSD